MEVNQIEVVLIFEKFDEVNLYCVVVRVLGILFDYVNKVFSFISSLIVEMMVNIEDRDFFLIIMFEWNQVCVEIV